MKYRSLTALLLGVFLCLTYPTQTTALEPVDTLKRIQAELAEIAKLVAELHRTPTTRLTADVERSDVRLVPFYSQFADITKPGWQKIGCGIASTAMIIDYYSDAAIDVDALLEVGIARDAYLSDAGWIHAGLIGLTRDYGLDGKTVSLSGLDGDAAVSELSRVLEDGPVMASVHYTFEPTNPIPHLVVINAIKDGRVYYNDPAQTGGNRHLSVEQFKKGWKQRYIVIRPV